MDHNISTFESGPATLEKSLKKKKARDTSSRENSFETISLQSQFYTAHHTPVDDNLEDYFNGNDWTFNINEPQALDDPVVPRSTLKLLEKQKYENFCPLVPVTKASVPNSGFYEGEDEHRSYQHPSIPGIKQTVILHSLRGRKCTNAHLQKFARHHGVTQMYAIFWQTYYWLQMPADVISAVRDCLLCAKNQVCLLNRNRALKLIPAFELLESVIFNILGPLLKRRRVFQFTIAFADRFTKEVQVVSWYCIRSVDIAHVFWNIAPQQVWTAKDTTTRQWKTFFQLNSSRL